MKGRLFLIPSPLGDNNPGEVIPQPVLDLLPKITHYAVEEVRTVRRYLSKAGLKGKIDGLSFYLLNEHSEEKDVEEILEILLDGNDVGMISEAGLPAVADPGSRLVELSHFQDIEVIPFVGPSSLMMALMASGMNGQRFAFNGYLPIKPLERKTAIRNLEKHSRKEGFAELFIETPYRNDSILSDILLVCDDNTRICVATDITLPTQNIKTKSVRSWKKNKIQIGKRPTVFIIQAKSLN
ncbi:MAG: SAM-dependent methyltransferase [Bacteroidales bacterium]